MTVTCVFFINSLLIMKLKNICRIVYSPKKNSEEPPSAHKAQSEGVSVEKDKTGRKNSGEEYVCVYLFTHICAVHTCIC